MAAWNEARSRAGAAEAEVACPVGEKADSASNDAECAVSTPNPAFRADVLAGLSARPRAIPARWFYDRRGSELFEDITRLPKYYLTRTERAILATNAANIAELTGPGHAVVEFGSGSSAKRPLVLSAVSPSVY